MDEIATRLKETSEACIKAYDLWEKDKKEVEPKEELQEAVHELRKVASRLEIELAVSERDENGRAIPIQSHQSRGKNNNYKRPPKNKPPQKPLRDNRDNISEGNSSLPGFISADTPPKKPAPRRRSSQSTPESKKAD